MMKLTLGVFWSLVGSVQWRSQNSSVATGKNWQGPGNVEGKRGAHQHFGCDQLANRKGASVTTRPGGSGQSAAKGKPKYAWHGS